MTTICLQNEEASAVMNGGIAGGSSNITAGDSNNNNSSSAMWLHRLPKSTSTSSLPGHVTSTSKGDNETLLDAAVNSKEINSRRFKTGEGGGGGGNLVEEEKEELIREEMIDGSGGCADEDEDEVLLLAANHHHHHRSSPLSDHTVDSAHHQRKGRSHSSQSNSIQPLPAADGLHSNGKTSSSSSLILSGLDDLSFLAFPPLFVIDCHLFVVSQFPSCAHSFTVCLFFQPQSKLSCEKVISVIFVCFSRHQRDLWK